MSVLAPEPVTTDSGGDDDDLYHYVCDCNENIALCGKDVSDLEFAAWDATDKDDCALCVLADEWPCPHCGAV